MKRVLLSADSEISVYSVANEVADNLEKYCSEFRCHWLYESPDAGKYRTKIGDTVVVCYSEKDFIDYLNRLIELNDPTVTILVSSNKENYDYIDKKIKTKVSNSIYKGIKILYRNKVYDFSLNEGNV